MRKPETLRPGWNGSAACDFDAGDLDARRHRVKRGSIRNLPTEKADALPAVGVDDEPLLAIIHAEGEARAGLVDALKAEELFAIARPIAHVLGANTDIA